MNETIKTQLNHRTIREFEDREVDEKTLNILLDVLNKTATSTGMQQYSIIRVKNTEKREKLSKISKQEYLKRCPELFVFIVDIYRNKRIVEEMNSDAKSYKDMDRFFQGFTDACLAAQNMTVALESMGMGAVYFGSILNDYDSVCEILNLPEYTFPVFAVGFGYPAQDPQLKPRMPMELKIFTDEYEKFDNYLEKIKDYDEEMTNYYDTRMEGRRSDCFSKQVVKQFENIVELRKDVLNSIEKQGFNIK